MSLKKHIAIAATALVLLSTGAVASAQTTGTASTSATTGVTTATTPGTPNTGAGGDAPYNWAVLAVSGLVVLGGIGYLTRRPTSQGSR